MIDKYGEGVYADLRFYYGIDLVDVIRGELAPSLVLALVQRLPDDSLTTALALGGREHFQWGLDRHLLTDVFDALQINTRATGNWKKGKTPDFEPWPRPKVPEKKDTDGPRKSKLGLKDIYQKLRG